MYLNKLYIAFCSVFYVPSYGSRCFPSMECVNWQRVNWPWVVLYQYLSIDRELINLEYCFLDLLCRPRNARKRADEDNPSSCHPLSSQILRQRRYPPTAPGNITNTNTIGVDVQASSATISVTIFQAVQTVLGKVPQALQPSEKPKSPN